MSTSKSQYQRESIQGVLAAAGLRPDNEHLPFDYLRSKIDALDDDHELTAGVADFWLDLDQPTGAARRRELHPPSPFRKRRRALIAAKSKIADWDLEWRKNEAAHILIASKSPHGSELAKKFLPMKQPMVMTWVGELKVVVGAAVWLPESAKKFDPTRIDIRWMRADQALGKPWLDPTEGDQFLTLLRAAQRLEADALETIQRGFNTAAALGARDPKDDRL